MILLAILDAQIQWGIRNDTVIWYDVCDTTTRSVVWHKRMPFWMLGDSKKIIITIKIGQACTLQP